MSAVKNDPNAGDLDRRYVWHPFTQMRDWLREEPVVIRSGKGAHLWDVDGNRYLDGNSSIWTNLHGHQHPKLNAALTEQLGRIAHSSALGLANEPASELAAELVALTRYAAREGEPDLAKVFYSDDGSTALEVALKLSFESSRRQGRVTQPRFLSIDAAYHGDTIGSVSLGQVGVFHQSFDPLLFRVDKAMSPHCYRCPFNKAKPERANATSTRQCGFECVDLVASAFEDKRKRDGEGYAAISVEPRIQGVAGMIPQPEGWLSRVVEIARSHGAQVIADEVMTGFGRTGPLFASAAEGVRPDFLCLAKGLTGGYLPMAATLTTEAVFDAFLGDYSEVKTFFHGHSYTGNQLGAAVSLASLDVLRTESPETVRNRLATVLSEALDALWEIEWVGDIRQCGLIAGVELVRDWRERTPFDWSERVGVRVCEALRRRGILTRPIGNVVTLMPPYCVTESEIQEFVGALRDSILEILNP